MAIAGRFQVKAIFVLGLTLLSCKAEGAFHNRRSLLDPSGGAGAKIFDVTQFGAKADDKTDNAQSFIQTWRAACNSSDPAKVVIPQGTFLTSPVVFQGPCCSPSPVFFEVQGYVKATTDLSQYSSPEWILFEIIDGLALSGGGTFDGQGSTAWQYNDCQKNKDCQSLPDTMKFMRVNNSVVSNITSVNSKYFHLHLGYCNNVTFESINITAPSDSPNTDGIHISNSNLVNVSNSVIGTGDDCISVGQGVTNLSVSKIFCGPGHGISVGSLGKYQNEKDVSGIVVVNCTLSNTTNGARIKTYAASPPSRASNIIFQDLIMDNVQNPIIIDQRYGSSSAAPSQVKISDIHFRNIKGSSTSDVAVNFVCSSSVPCEVLELVDIDLTYTGTRGNGTISASCQNANVTTSGVQNPAACH